ncbi:MAG: PLP-dependent aminotransferase family protein [Planctomycetaceae bacterium]
MTTTNERETTLPPISLSHRWRWAQGQAISFLMQQAVENPECISLAAGLVDPSSLPVTETRAAFDTLFKTDERARTALQYGTTQGADKLRKGLIGQLARLENCTPGELGIDADQLILTTGSQQFLSLVGEVLLDPGDICLVAAPTYFVFLGVLNGLGARAIPVEADDDGMRMDALEATLRKIEADGELDRVKLIYLVSYYENPSGVSLSAERRKAAVGIAQRWSRAHRIMILEDAAYRELQYDGPTLPSIWGFDGERESVILAQTFSKSFSPGVRVGFGVVPRALVGPICDRKGNEDFGSANLNQHLLAAVIEHGLYDTHVEEVRTAYRRKRDCMLRAIDESFRDLSGVRWVRPHGGLYVWMTLPESIPTGFDSALFTRASRVDQVMYVPGELCYPGPLSTRPRNQMRLSFGVQTEAGIEAGIARLASAVRAVLPAP